MKSNIYLIVRSLIQGLYRGSLFTFCLWSLIIIYSYLSNPYLLSTIFNGVLNYKIDTFERLSSMGDRLLMTYIAVILIAILLSAVDNFVVKRNR